MNAWGWTFVAVLTVAFIVIALGELRWIRRADAKLQELIAETDKLLAERQRITALLAEREQGDMP